MPDTLDKKNDTFDIQKNAISIKCPNDGSSDIEWKIDKQEFQCNYCQKLFPHITNDEGSKLEIINGKFNGITVSSNLRNSFTVPSTLRKFKCDNCGGEIISSTKTDMSQKCSWCHRNLVMGDVVQSEFTPDGIIPFLVSKTEAIQSFQKWVKSHKFVHRNFAANLNSDDNKFVVKAVYYPFYAIDETLNDKSNGKGETSTSQKRGNYLITTTYYYSFDYEANLLVNDYAKPALSEISNKVIINQIRPFDWTKIVPFDYAYLTNYNAEMRDSEFGILQEEIENEIKASAIEGSKLLANPKLNFTKNIWNHSIQENSETVAYVLAPVWLITYIDDLTKKLYYFSVNGESGKVSGVLPLSYLKMSIFAGVSSLLGAIIAVILAASLMLSGGI